MSEKGVEEKKHTLKMAARAHVEICGVLRVDSFDEQSVILLTDCGEMTLEGEELHIGTLDIERGVVSVDGQIGMISYADAVPSRRGFKGRFFG